MTLRSTRAPDSSRRWRRHRHRPPPHAGVRTRHHVPVEGHKPDEARFGTLGKVHQHIADRQDIAFGAEVEDLVDPVRRRSNTKRSRRNPAGVSRPPISASSPGCPTVVAVAAQMSLPELPGRRHCPPPIRTRRRAAEQLVVAFAAFRSGRRQCCPEQVVAFATVSRSLSSPPNRESLPAPPRIISSPPSPKMVSSPRPPSIGLALRTEQGVVAAVVLRHIDVKLAVSLSPGVGDLDGDAVLGGLVSRSGCRRRRGSRRSRGRWASVRRHRR